MKWINLWIEKLIIISTRNCLQFSTTTGTLHKSKKYQGVKEKKCLCPHVRCVAA